MFCVLVIGHINRQSVSYFTFSLCFYLFFSLFSAFVDLSSPQGGTVVRVCSVFAVERETSAQRMILRTMSTAHLRIATVAADHSSYLVVLRDEVLLSVTAALLPELCSQPTGKCTAQWTAMEWSPWLAGHLCQHHQSDVCYLR